MKVKAFLIAAFAAVALSVGAATSQNDGVITVKVNKASKALVERWIEGYKAVNPNVEIALVSGKNADADLTLVTRHQEDGNVTYVGRYALLPVTSTENPLLNDIQKKEWKSKDIKSLFFTAEDLDEEYEEEVEGKKNKLKDKLTVYSGAARLPCRASSHLTSDAPLMTCVATASLAMISTCSPPSARTRLLSRSML